MPEIYLNFQAMYIILYTNYSRYRQRKTQSCMHTVVCTCAHTHKRIHIALSFVLSMCSNKRRELDKVLWKKIFSLSKCVENL